MKKNRNFWGFPKGHMEEGETENAKWCNFEEALDILTFENWKEMFKKVIDDINKNQ